MCDRGDRWLAAQEEPAPAPDTPATAAPQPPTKPVRISRPKRPKEGTGQSEHVLRGADDEAPQA